MGSSVFKPKLFELAREGFSIKPKLPRESFWIQDGVAHLFTVKGNCVVESTFKGFLKDEQGRHKRIALYHLKCLNWCTHFLSGDSNGKFLCRNNYESPNWFRKGDGWGWPIWKRGRFQAAAVTKGTYNPRKMALAQIEFRISEQTPSWFLL